MGLFPNMGNNRRSIGGAFESAGDGCHFGQAVLLTLRCMWEKQVEISIAQTSNVSGA